MAARMEVNMKLVPMIGAVALSSMLTLIPVAGILYSAM
jgi:hypothetical protein